MIENLVAAWLTEASERSYESAFAQLLLIEGHNVLQGPMHHSHEHGKDIIAFDDQDRLCVYQLKGGPGKLNTLGVEAVQGQLLAAAATAVNHPGLAAPRLPDRVYLVTNQKATGPAQGLISVLSNGNVLRGLPPLSLVEYDGLLSRFVKAEGRFFPSSPEALKTFLTLFLSDGRGPIPEEEFFSLLTAILPVAGKRLRAGEAQRVISAGVLTVAFALKPWADLQNHAEVAMGWVYYCSQVIRSAQRLGLGTGRWHDSYGLAFEEARRHLRLLVAEALEAQDLVMGHPAEPVVYSARAVKVCGLASALLLSELIEFGDHSGVSDDVRTLLLRELDSLKVVTESQAPAYFLIVLALFRLGEIKTATQHIFRWIVSLAQANHPDSEMALPDPYHTPQDALLNIVAPGEVEDLEDEEFAGRAYTLDVGVRWAARRWWRQFLAGRWSAISRVENCVFEPEKPVEYLCHRSPNGVLRTWRYPCPTSWQKLLKSSEALDVAALPKRLLDQAEFIPLYCLAFPHRFNGSVADLLDHLGSGR